jgi:hypothetical protein
MADRNEDILRDAGSRALDAAQLDPRIDKLVSDKLRGYFDSLMDERVPDRIVELLNALASKEAGPESDKP